MLGHRHLTSARPPDAMRRTLTVLPFCFRQLRGRAQCRSVALMPTIVPSQRGPEVEVHHPSA